MLIQYTFNQDIENNSCFVPLCTDNILIFYYQTEKKNGSKIELIEKTNLKITAFSVLEELTPMSRFSVA